MLELKVKELEKVKDIEFNYEELKNEITIRVAKYKTMVYTDNSIAEAKDDRAALNKWVKTVNDRRIELEKEYMKPFDEFKKQVNELLEIVKEPIKIIDDQIKEYELKQIEEKTEKIVEIFNKVFEDENIKKLVPLGKLWNDKWKNTTYKLKEIETEITTAYSNFEKGYRIITELKSPHENRLIDAYLRNLDIAEAMLEKTRIEDQEAQLAKLKAEAEQRKAEEQRQAESMAKLETKIDGNTVNISVNTGENAEESIINNIQFNKDEVNPAIPEATMEDPVTVVAFKVKATASQLEKLKAFLIENKIPYAKA